MERHFQIDLHDRLTEIRIESKMCADWTSALVLKTITILTKMQLKQLAVLKRYDKEGIKWVGAIEKEVDDLASSFKDMEKNSQKLQAIYKSFMEYI